MLYRSGFLKPPKRTNIIIKMIPLHKIINRPSRWLKSLAGAAALALGLTISEHAATPTYQLLKTFTGASTGSGPKGEADLRQVAG